MTKKKVLSRELTREEYDVLELLALAGQQMKELDQIIPRDRYDFVFHIQAAQNIIFSRPSADFISEYVERYGRGMYTRLGPEPNDYDEKE